MLNDFHNFFRIGIEFIFAGQHYPECFLRAISENDGSAGNNSRKIIPFLRHCETS